MDSKNLGILIFQAVLKLKSNDFLDCKSEIDRLEVVQLDLK